MPWQSGSGLLFCFMKRGQDGARPSTRAARERTRGSESLRCATRLLQAFLKRGRFAAEEGERFASEMERAGDEDELRFVPRG